MTEVREIIRKVIEEHASNTIIHVSPWPAEQVSQISQELTETLGIGNFQINAYTQQEARVLVPEGFDPQIAIDAINRAGNGITVKIVKE